MSIRVDSDVPEAEPPVQGAAEGWTAGPASSEPEAASVSDADVAPTAPLAPPARERRAVSRALVPFAAAVLGAVVGAASMAYVSERPAPTNAVRVAPPLSGEARSLSGVAAVADKVTPSVVRIDVGSTRFGRRSTGTGSGVIYTADGYIVTNEHVVDGASTVRVTLASGDQLQARVIGDATPSDDIAVIKVDRSDLPAATFGSTSDLRVGDVAVAIGSPFGLQGTVTAGVVSALHRNVDLGAGARFADAIQTDAPINPGNSGGALAAANGTVIGINTAIVGGGGGNVGVGFAIPIEIVRRDADQIIRTGHASRPFLGISGQSVPDGGGARVEAVQPGGAAERGGLQAGDVIVEFEGSRIRSMDDLVSALSRLDVGKTAKVTYLRDGARATAQVTLGSPPND